MEEKIRTYLSRLEKEHNIEILLACETGSRAWGFPSPDSDYDVRIIYRHPVDWYLSLNDQKDSIEQMLDNNEIDISGWDLKKSLNLLWKSNSSLMERIQSPIVYRVDKPFLDGITTLAPATYSKIAAMHHYLSMAKKFLEEIKGREEYKLKKLFYALRTAIACQWILEKDVMPPIVFPVMLENLSLDDRHVKRIYELIALKKQQSEAYLHPDEPDLIGLLEEIVHRADREYLSLPASKGNIEDMNAFFRKMLLS